MRRYISASVMLKINIVTSLIWMIAVVALRGAYNTHIFLALALLPLAIGIVFYSKKLYKTSTILNSLSLGITLFPVLAVLTSLCIGLCLE